MANKKKTKADRPKTDNPNVKGLHAEVLEQNSYYRKAWADYRAARSITYSVKGGQDDDK